MRRRCSNKGHNSRTLSSGGVRLFGVRLTDGSISVMKKSASMANLSSFSDDPHKKKGLPIYNNYPLRQPLNISVPWTEEEHRLFLAGLQKLGKGDWRGIARDFVVSRTATQVASHAQKYFIRQSSVIRRRRRSSLFDMAPDMATDQPPVPEEQILLPPPAHTKESDDTNPLNLSLNSELQPEEKIGEASGFQRLSPGFFQSYVPVPYTIWPPSVAPPTDNDKGTENISHYRVIKPTPIHPQEPVNVNEVVGMSRLNIGEAENGALLSLKLLGEPSRQSAFHASGPSSGSGLGNEKSKSVVQAV